MGFGLEVVRSLQSTWLGNTTKIMFGILLYFGVLSLTREFSTNSGDFAKAGVLVQSRIEVA